MPAMVSPVARPAKSRKSRHADVLLPASRFLGRADHNAGLFVRVRSPRCWVGRHRPEYSQRPHRSLDTGAMAPSSRDT